MLDIKFCYDAREKKKWLETSVSGKALLMTPQLNKGTAFSEEEREKFNLLGKLPAQIETIEEQISRAYQQFSSYQTNLQRNIYLGNLHDSNQVLFYALVSQHLQEMIPVIYTPIVGTAVKQFSQEFRTPRGLYINYTDINRIDKILDNRSNPDIDILVVTDGEGVLGIGDQGIGGMDIPVAKLMVYGLCGGINPINTLPILLDVGTNNQALLDDPMYLGLRHKRITGKDYDKFIEKFVTAVKRKFPNVFLHWEDFGRTNARRNLERFRNEVCTFNDDMQGTGVVTVAAILAAVKAAKSSLKEQRIVIFGAGTAGTGIADQICAAMIHEGMSSKEARACFWLLDRPGLLTENLSELTEAQRPYARAISEVSSWHVSNNIGLAEVINQVRPSILIGCSAQTGAFSQPIIEAMASGIEHPIILPLSNPTEQCEATPQDLMNWTKGKALIATGSPFDPMVFNGKSIPVGQCNNALVFPGIGLGVVAAQAQSLTEEMLWAACVALAEFAPIHKDPHAPLLPSLEKAKEAARHIAIAVVNQARREGVARTTPDDVSEELVQARMWEAHYLPFKRR